jgi:spore coat protein U-like protein
MRKLLMTAATAAMLAGGAAQSATTTATFVVSATVLAACSATANPLAFGTYTPSGGDKTGSTTVNVKCTKNTPFTVTLNAGTTTGATQLQRLLVDSTSDTLNYNLYTDATATTTIFGDGTGGTGKQTGTGAGLSTAVAVNVYGRLTDSGTNLNAAAGSYSDTITATVTY